MATANQGPWSRLFKRKNSNGEWMRGFANSGHNLFALVSESAQGSLQMIGTCNSAIVLEAMAGANAPAPPAVSLFQKYPPTAYDLSHGNFTGVICAGLFEPDQGDGEGMQFMLTYEMEDDCMYDDHSTSINQLVYDLLGPVFGNRLVVSVEEGTHAVKIPGVVCDDESSPQYQQLSDQVRALLIQAGVKMWDGQFYNSVNNPGKNNGP